jgi:tetratricopeptide (TPR) repeat protein
MHEYPPTVSGVRAAAHRVAVFFVALLFATGCVSLEHQADRAFDAGNHKEAQTLYKQAIAEGEEDPNVYLKAARNELKLGNFASAERFYTQSLKYGGGPNVAKELARYYVETSNYVSAVRVYQYLLYEVEDSQPVYNNLGTALLYAGRPFDAESYLMVAQQMEPRDPLPYLNLGLLYDQHLKQPWLAINFYSCFVEMSGQIEQRRQAAQRIREIESQWAKLYDPRALECGQVYEPQIDQPVDNLAEKVGGGAAPIDLDTGESQEPQEPSDIIVERMVESLPDGTEAGKPEETVLKSESKKTDPPNDEQTSKKSPVGPVEAGRKAFASKDWAGTVDAMTSVSLKDLETRDLAMLGAAYFQLKKFTDSAQWLETVANRDAQPDHIVLLVDAYIRAGEFESAANTCDRFGTRSNMDAVAKYCETRMKALKEERAKQEEPE